MIFLVSLVIGVIFFVWLQAVLRMRKYLPLFQTKVRLQNLSDLPSQSEARTPAPRKSSVFMATRDLSTFSFRERIIMPIIHAIQNLFLKLAPRAIYKTVEESIIRAGMQDVWSLNKIIFAWGMCIVGCFFVGMLIFTTSDLQLIQRVMLLLIATTIGAALPMSYLRAVVSRRQEKIVLQLPPFLDLLSVSVQAGLSFDASLDRILRRSTGPLADEFKRMQRDMRLGLAKRDALREMAKRVDVEEMYLFTTSVIQAERLGTSMGKTLLDQANNMRDRYQQHIKAQALKAPIKILFPLVLFIFPTIFIIVLMPPLISVLNNLQIIPRG